MANFHDKGSVLKTHYRFPATIFHLPPTAQATCWSLSGNRPFQFIICSISIMAANSHTAGAVEVMQLNESSRRQREEQQEQMLALEAKSLAAQLVVPTLPEEVRAALRQLGEPVRLFGENPANVRDRLKAVMADRKVRENFELAQQQPVKKEVEEEEVTKYTRATPALVEARQAIAVFSLQRAKERLERERRLRAVLARDKKRKAALVSDDDYDSKLSELEKLDADVRTAYKKLGKLVLEGSQYGDSRTMSCLACADIDGLSMVVSGSWTSSLFVWRGGLSSGGDDDASSTLPILAKRTQCHEDRIMGIDVLPIDNGQAALVATTSIDKTAKLWKIERADGDVAMAGVNTEEVEQYSITEQHALLGHAARLCRAAFHPMHKHVATTSFDHTWRLWDIETAECLLLQDGHWKETYGIGFHPDGSLVATTDLAGVVHLWDLRTGKTVQHYVGHAGRVLNADWHPRNGFQLATAGDDGTIQIWDIRRRKSSSTVSIPAHNSLVTRLRFDETGEYLASSSFDGTVKLWGCRKWNMLNQVEGHQGKVTSVDILSHGNGIVSCGFDKTLKLWR